jgi:hypothetical protein
MQAEKATAWLPGEASLLGLESVAVELVLDVCDPRLATPPLGAPAPQPARSVPAASSTAATQAAPLMLPVALIGGSL